MPGEEVLVLMVITPLIFYDIIATDLYNILVSLTKIYLSLIYRVDGTNVAEWSTEARAMAKKLFEWNPEWEVTLNWHLICHWETIVNTHGPVRRYWAWVMERFNGLMKHLIYTTNFKDVQASFHSSRFLDYLG